MEPAPPVLAGLSELNRTHGSYRRAVRMLRWVAPIGVLTLTVLAARAVPSHAALRWVSFGGLGGFAAGACGATLMRGRPRRPHTWLWALLLASSAVLVVAGPARIGTVGMVIAFVVAPWRAVGRSSIALVSAVGLIAAAFAVARDASLLDAGCAALTVGCLATVACLARRLGAANELAGRLVRDLEASRERERESAADGMRHSIARDLHDILAHSLSALVLHLDAARTIAADSVDSDLQTALDRAHHLARAGLDEARQAIGVLRDDRSLPGPDELPALVEQFGLATGTPCTLRQRGQPRALGHEIQLNVYRVAQEALTNIARHADATAAAVMLEYAPDCVRLVVQDDGRTAAACQDPLTAGYGLSGMAERAELLDGCLTAGPTSAGFRVELVVPT